jgi:hypothetical protein
MLSASNIPVPDHSDHSSMVLLLPSWQFIDNVTPANIPELITMSPQISDIDVQSKNARRALRPVGTSTTERV